MPRNKTREEKIKSAYRLKDFKIVEEARHEQKDASEFAYLDSSFVKKDLTRTIVVSAVMIALIVAAKRFLG